MKDSDITRHADQILTKAKIEGPPVHVLELAKLHGITVRSGQLPPELSGFLVHEDQSVFIGVNSSHSKPRQAFTVAHELGHFVLHPTSNFVDRKLIFYRNTRSTQAIDIKEMQANQFAADLLMPQRFLRKALKGETIDLEDEELLASLAKKFGVSVQALVYRLINLDLGQHPKRR